jgi:hypothetical protein
MDKQYKRMEYLNKNNQLNKYQVTIHFTMTEDGIKLLPTHRAYINELIETNIIEYYSVSMESKRAWMIVNAEKKDDVEDYLQGSPLFDFWEYEIDELFLYDGQTYRLPTLQFN